MLKSAGIYPPTIVGGSIDGAAIGVTTRGVGRFSKVSTGAGSVFAWSGSSTTDDQLMALYTTHSAVGSYTGTSAFGHNRVVVSADTVDASSMIGTISALKVNHNFGGGSCVGSRSAIDVTSRSTGAYDAGAAGFQIAQLSATFTSRADVSQGGTSGARRGGVWALNTNCIINTAASYYAAIYGAELDMNCAAGTNPGEKFGLAIYSSGDDKAQGVVADVAVLVAQAPTSTAGWRHAFALGRGQNTLFPLSTDGTILGVIPQAEGTLKPMDCAYGIDFDGIAFSADIIRADNFAVSGAGNITSAGLTGRNFSDDAAASSGGVPVGGLYHNAGAVRVRLA